MDDERIEPDGFDLRKKEKTKEDLILKRLFGVMQKN